jgi:hypothetical protein
MRTTIILTALCFGFCNAGLAQNDTFSTLDWLCPVSFTASNSAPNYVSAPESVPVMRILPENIVPDSIQLVRWSTNTFAVRWTFTEAGAKRMLTFWEAHVGQTICTEVGSYKSTTVIAPCFQPQSFRPMPGCATYSEWREGWLKHRTDKFCGVSRDDAKRIIAGLKND